jgi:hypothetical protein
MSRVPLDLVACPDRRLPSAAVQLVARELADGDTEVSVLLPDRKYTGLWHRILHDRTADAIERAVSQLAHANVTTVPFHFGDGATRRPRRVISPAGRRRGRRAPAPPADVDVSPVAAGAPPPDVASVAPGVDGVTPIAGVRWRERVTVAGTIATVRMDPSAGTWLLECVLEDGTGALSLVFTGRREIGGIELGTHLRAEGTVAAHRGRLALFNPAYTLLIAPR